MARNGIINNGSPISMEEAENILDMAIQVTKKLKERLSQFNKSNVSKHSIKDEQRER